jgi:hypothetical protein
MQPYQLLTTQMIELLLPTLGFSLILNVLLISAILFRSIRHWIFNHKRPDARRRQLERPYLVRSKAQSEIV